MKKKALLAVEHRGFILMSKARSRGRALARTQCLADVLEPRAGLQIGFVQQVAESLSANDCGRWLLPFNELSSSGDGIIV